MAGKNNIYNKNDSMDINELAALNDDISDDMLEQLTAQLTKNISVENTTSEDAALFEEPAQAEPIKNESSSEISGYDNKSKTVSDGLASESKKNAETNLVSEGTVTKKESVKLDESFDDNFIKKYKAKLNKQTVLEKSENPVEDKLTKEQTVEPIEKISQGNITEKNISKEQIEYNDSLDFLDGNVKYSKYVIYVDPQNVDFIESLTVKERKNLINGILKQQGDIALTKRRFKVIETIVRHVIVAILTIAVSIPVIYYAINASLEATINNHRQSQAVWQALYRENGKISNQKN